MRVPGTVRRATAVAVMLVLVGAIFSPARAGGVSDLIIHSRLCPAEYVGDNLFADCHDTPFSMSFTISGPISLTVVTDASGNALAPSLHAGQYTVVSAAPSHTELVYCSPYGGLPSPEADGQGHRISIPSDYLDPVICDWYFIPHCVEGENCPTPTPDGGAPGDTGGNVTGLPNTGVGGASASSGDFALYGLGALALGLTALLVRRRARQESSL